MFPRAGRSLKVAALTVVRAAQQATKIAQARANIQVLAKSMWKPGLFIHAVVTLIAVLEVFRLEQSSERDTSSLFSAIKIYTSATREASRTTYDTLGDLQKYISGISEYFDMGASLTNKHLDIVWVVSYFYMVCRSEAAISTAAITSCPQWLFDLGGRYTITKLWVATVGFLRTQARMVPPRNWVGDIFVDKAYMVSSTTASEISNIISVVSGDFTGLNLAGMVVTVNQNWSCVKFDRARLVDTIVKTAPETLLGTVTLTGAFMNSATIANFVSVFRGSLDFSGVVLLNGALMLFQWVNMHSSIC